MALDRTKAPKVKSNTEYNFLTAETQYLKNGVPLHVINSGEQEVMRLQLVFNAGSIYQDKAIVAAAVNELILEGTKKHSSEEISNLFENKGAFIDTELSSDNASINLYCLSSVNRISELKELLFLLKEVIQEAIFPEEEIKHFVQVKRQNFSVNSKRVAFVARNNFLAFLLGSKHAYANKVESEDFDNLTREDLLNFYERFYLKGALEIYVSGKVDRKVQQLIKEVFDDCVYNKVEGDKLLEFSLPEISEKRIPIQSVLQTAIRMGCPVIDKKHPDFIPLYVANTILGGYFGSRLMNNIREDKGFTYGIQSSIIVQQDLAYFMIATEVGEQHKEATMHEIKKELDLLSDNLVGTAELNLVKNYLRGSILKNFDGAFAAMDRFRSVNQLQLKDTYYYDLLKGIEAVEPEDIQFVSRKYLNWNKIKSIIVG